MRTLSGHSSDVISCSFSLDGANVISGSGDSTLKIWDAVTGASFPVRFELVLHSSRANTNWSYSLFRDPMPVFSMPTRY